MISLTCCTRRDNRSLDPDCLPQKGEGTASSTLRVTDLGSARQARTTAVATTLELQLQRYVLKCWQSVASDGACYCNYNVRLHMIGLHNTPSCTLTDPAYMHVCNLALVAV